MAGLKDLDAADYQAALEALKQNDTFGATPEERLATLATEKRLVLIATIIACVVAAWGLLWPHPHEWAVGANVAAFALVIVATVLKQGRWRLDAQKNDPRPTAAIALWAPAVALAARAIFDEETFDWLAWLGWAAAVGVAVALGANALFAELRKPAGLILTGILGAVFGLGAIGEANASLDTAQAQVFQAQIIDQYESHGRSTSYDLVLGPWGPSRGGSQSVSYEMYAAHRAGDTICIGFHPGALHIRWYVLQECAAATQADKPADTAEPFDKPPADK